MGGIPSMHYSASNNSPERTFRTVDPKQPIPDHDEVEARFHNVLASMDLPPDKMRLLKSYDDERKWDLLCDQEKVSAKEPPESYLEKLKLYLAPSSHKNSKALKKLGDVTSTQILRNLEISLRTNPIGWVRLFLGEEHNGLDVLVQYLSMTQEHMRIEQISQGEVSDRSTWQPGTSCSLPDRSSITSTHQRPLFHPRAFSRDSTLSSPSLRASLRRTLFLSRPHKHNYGPATDDVHVCIMCLRAIMNHQYGFNLVFAHEQAINCITLSLNHNNYRTKTLVLELLAAVCLVSGGHQMIYDAFDNFKKVCQEDHRFQTLMQHFRHFEDFHIDFMVACMQFINIIVHSVENMNFRVHLQHEFSLLGLDGYLQNLRHTESERLPVQVNAYLDNTIEVQMLLDESEMKNMALEKVAELEEELSHTLDSLHEQEDIACSTINELHAKAEDVMRENEDIKLLLDQQATEIEHLKNAKQKDVLVTSSSSSSSSSGISSKVSSGPLPISPSSYLPPPLPEPTSPSIPPPPPPPAPPPMNIPPPPPFIIGVPPPPPLIGSTAVSIKKAIQPMHRLPVLNWVTMKPNEVKGTMFNDLDDEKLYKVINFHEFESIFKLGNSSLVDVDGSEANGVAGTHKIKKKPEKLSLLDPNRLRNVAITRRKIEIRDDEIVKAINSIDLLKLSVDRVEILLKIVPNEQEVKVMKDYEKDKKPLDLLTDEDRFQYTLTKVERLQPKLIIMSFIGNFYDTFHHLQPQLQAVTDASNSIRDSKKLRKLFEIVLAFGNYMNSCKRGAVYGFRPQSLDMLTETRSSDKKLSLLMFIVKTVKAKFSDLASFDAEIRHLEKASSVSIENIMADIVELDRGMEMTKRECSHRKEAPLVMRDFVANSEEKIKKLKLDAKVAQDAYSKVIEYFGENAKTFSPNAFFSIFLRFIRAFKQAEVDLQSMARLEEAQKTIKESVRENKKGNKKVLQQETMVGELKQKQKIREKKVLNREEVCHGTLEDILLDLKSEPYRRADAVRRSQRKGKELNSFYGNNNFPMPV